MKYFKISESELSRIQKEEPFHFFLFQKANKMLEEIAIENKLKKMKNERKN